jgi:hemerythrin-like domain-containing protein
MANLEHEKEAQIITKIRDEHKYCRILMSTLKDQLNKYSIGKTADYDVMLEILNYMVEYPDKFNHPAKLKLLDLIMEKEPENSDLALLQSEKNQIETRAFEVVRALKAIIKEESILREEQLKIFSKDFVELIESHISVESQQLLPKAKELLSDQEFIALEESLSHEDDHDFFTLIETRYKSLNAILLKRWDNFEGAANDIAVAEFLSISALFESIGPLTVGMTEISKLVKDYSYKMFMANYNCYKGLVTQIPDDKSDLYHKPVNCMKDCYDDYKDGLAEVSGIWDKTRQEIKEPYTSRQEFVDELRDDYLQRNKKA